MSESAKKVPLKYKQLLEKSEQREMTLLQRVEQLEQSRDYLISVLDQVCQTIGMEFPLPAPMLEDFK